MKTFKFPAGTTKISKKELKDVCFKYERVEMPDSVLEIDALFSDQDNHRFIVKEFVLNDGIQSLKLIISRKFSINVPKTLLEIVTNAQLPQVICLPENFIHLECGINGVEYLQAYGESEVRNILGKYCKLKHYVILGKKLSPKKHLFDFIPDGCVIHVESNKMAEKVLKRGGFDISKVYVVADALEWKDFPADKIALTMEEYNPESRITTAQIKLQEKKAEEAKQKAEEHAQKERERSKGKIMGGMILPFVKNFLSDKGLEYKISEIVIERELDILFQLSEKLYILAGIQPERPEESLGHIVDVTLKIKDLYSRYQEDIALLHILIRQSCGFDPKCPYISIPIAKEVFVTGNMRIKSLAPDTATITSFANELKLILDEYASKQTKIIINNRNKLWL